MNEQSISEPDDMDSSSTVRLPVRNTVLAQIEAALLADKLSVSFDQARHKGIDPYNRAPPDRDAWALKR